MTLDELPGWARELIRRERVGRLAFLDDAERPRVLPVTFALAEGHVWSAIDHKPKRSGREPARVRFLRRNPAAALCVDRYDEDWSQLTWVQLLGRVDVLEASDGEAGLEALIEKYPQYSEERPVGPVLRLEVERALSWRAEE